MKVPTLSLRSLRALGRALVHTRDTWSRRLAPALRERIILHVSAVNRCAVCSAVHDRTAQVKGLSAADVRDARSCRIPSGDAPTLAALRYAAARTEGREEPALGAELERHFSPADRAEIRGIVDLFTFYNRFNNTWEALLPGAHARRLRLGIE